MVQTIVQIILEIAKTILGWLLLAGALLLLAGIGVWVTGPSSDELVLYPASCANGVQVLPPNFLTRDEQQNLLFPDYKKIQADRANCQILPLNRTVYKLNKARGEVYYNMGDLLGTRRLVDCAIFSRTDWACSYPDGSGKVVIIDGLRAIHSDDVNSGVASFYLRRWQWWGATLYWWIGRPRGAWLIPEQHQYF